MSSQFFIKHISMGNWLNTLIRMTLGHPERMIWTERRKVVSTPENQIDQNIKNHFFFFKPKIYC